MTVAVGHGSSRVVHRAFTEFQAAKEALQSRVQCILSLQGREDDSIQDLVLKNVSDASSEVRFKAAGDAYILTLTQEDDLRLVKRCKSAAFRAISAIYEAESFLKAQGLSKQANFRFFDHDREEKEIRALFSREDKNRFLQENLEKVNALIGRKLSDLVEHVFTFHAPLNQKEKLHVGCELKGVPVQLIPTNLAFRTIELHEQEELEALETYRGSLSLFRRIEEVEEEVVNMSRNWLRISASALLAQARVSADSEWQIVSDSSIHVCELDSYQSYGVNSGYFRSKEIKVDGVLVRAHQKNILAHALTCKKFGKPLCRWEVWTLSKEYALKSYALSKIKAHSIAKDFLVSRGIDQGQFVNCSLYSKDALQVNYRDRDGKLGSIEVGLSEKESDLFALHKAYREIVAVAEDKEFPKGAVEITV